jgi:hypothetical protein
VEGSGRLGFGEELEAERGTEKEEWGKGGKRQGNRVCDARRQRKAGYFFFKEKLQDDTRPPHVFHGPKNIGLGGVGLSSCYQGSVRFKKHTLWSSIAFLIIFLFDFPFVLPMHNASMPLKNIYMIECYILFTASYVLFS